MKKNKHYVTATHWGSYRIQSDGDKLTAITPCPNDPNPSPIGDSLLESLDHPVRITQPMVRKGWLEGRRSGRGSDSFVPMSWDDALNRVAGELDHCKTRYGNESIYAGSYGWASAGRFHHAQSQLRRFLNLYGGHVNTANTYSFAAAEVVIPHVVGSFYETIFASTTLESIASDGELVVAFGGWPLKNSQVNAGGVSRHEVLQGQKACAKAGVEFVYLGPTRDDMLDELNAQWLQPRPTTDTAVMLGLAHTLHAEKLLDRKFLDRCCVGFEVFERYLLGETDRQIKTAEWAAGISGLNAEDIKRLARKMAAKRTLLTASWSLQRAEYGEQPYWMLITLAAMLGQIGLPGAGFGFGHAAAEGIGTRWDHPVRPAALPVPQNPVQTLYPVSRVADMLLNPGGCCDYDGQCLVYPDIHLVYWCGGNPFHHHQDLNRLRKAWEKPDTIIVHEPWWTATARHADIVLPCSTSLERNDFTSGHCDWTLQAMQQVQKPHAQARHEYDIFADLAARLGFEQTFTEGKDADDWLRELWQQTRDSAVSANYELPDFDTFWQQGSVELHDFGAPNTLFAAFRAAPEAHPLATPSGKIELYSNTIAQFNYDSCPGHASWLAPEEWLGAKKQQQFPLHLISNQPKDKLHSQLDFASNSRKAKRKQRAVVSIHPLDAKPRGITENAIVRLFNARGACLACANLSDDTQPGVVILPTGAWYSPHLNGDDPALEVHGNPNVLTLDKGCSQLSQGPSAQSCLVEIAVFTGELPDVTAHYPPAISPDPAVE